MSLSDGQYYLVNMKFDLVKHNENIFKSLKLLSVLQLGKTQLTNKFMFVCIIS
jgi:hypothetical protein